MAPIALLVSLLVFAALPAFAEENSVPPTRPPASEQAWQRSRPPTSHLSPKEEAAKANAGAVEAATPRPPGQRSDYRPSDKKWENMTPDEQRAAQRRWLLNSGGWPEKGTLKAAPKPPASNAVDPQAPQR